MKCVILVSGLEFCVVFAACQRSLRIQDSLVDCFAVLTAITISAWHRSVCSDRAFLNFNLVGFAPSDGEIGFW